MKGTVPPSASSLAVEVTEESEMPVSRAIASRWVMRADGLSEPGGVGKNLKRGNDAGTPLDLVRIRMGNTPHGKVCGSKATVRHLSAESLSIIRHIVVPVRLPLPGQQNDGHSSRSSDIFEN